MKESTIKIKNDINFTSQVQQMLVAKSRLL